MINMIYFLQAAPAGGSAGPFGNMQGLLMIVLVFVVFYFFMIRPQMKKQKEIKKFREAIKVGDKIVTAGGLHGKIKDIKESTFIVEVADGVKMTIEKSSVFNSAADMNQR